MQKYEVTAKVRINDLFDFQACGTHVTKVQAKMIADLSLMKKVVRATDKSTWEDHRGKIEYSTRTVKE